MNTNNTAAITIAYSVGRGGAILGGSDCDDPSGIADGGRGAHGGNTTFGGVTAGYGGGGQGAGYSGAAAGGAGGSGDLVGETGPTGIFNRITSGSFWGKYGKGGAGSVGGHSGDRNACNQGNQQGGIVNICELIDTPRYDAQCIDIQTGIGFIENRYKRF